MTTSASFRWVAWVLSIAGCALGATAPAVHSQEWKVAASPSFTGKELPDPPKMGQEWLPPKTQLPESWISAAKLLLSYGFADPRGCDYHEVELAIGALCSRDRYLVETRAWVIPLSANAPPDARRFAVSWSGQVYPVERLGMPADWKVDAAAMLAKGAGSPHYGVVGERLMVSYEHPSALKALPALVLGEPALAENLWERYKQGIEENAKLSEKIRRGEPVADVSYQRSEFAQSFSPHRPTAGDRSQGDPYLQWCLLWGEAGFHRAVDAHFRGDDVVALHCAKPLIGLRTGVDRDGPPRGFPLREENRQSHSLLTFLHDAERLVEDQNRRAKEQPVERVLAAGAAPIEDQPTRIAALIRDLEFVAAPCGGNPGMLDLRDSPIVRALIKEGPAAVEPLIECLETDTRLARSINYGRSFHVGRGYVSVNSVAAEALSRILNTREFGPATAELRFAGQTPEQLRAAAKEVRDFYSRTKGFSEAEGRYITLADDQASPKQWLEAATKLTRRSRTAAGEIGPLAGEPLRAKKNPSVTELLIARANAIVTDEPSGSFRKFRLADACRMTLDLARWDPQAALPILHQRSREWLEQLESFPSSNPTDQVFWQMIVVGVDAGDDGFVDHYARWLKSASPRDVDDLEMAFRPFGRYPDHLKLGELAKETFSAGSRWLPLSEKARGNWASVIASPVVSHHAFRDYLHTQLSDKTASGTITVHESNGSFQLVFGGISSSGSLGSSAPGETIGESPRPVRVCDAYGWRLSGLAGAPQFQPYWPEARRDEAIVKVRTFLDRWHGAFRDRAPVDEQHGFGRVPFYLAPLDRPATEDDVRRGRAIFSVVRPGAEVRVVALPKHPSAAKWTTLKDFPLRPHRNPPTDPAAPVVVEYDQGGQVWQAEEILIDGQWQRFYGFVGAHIIAQVPAEEIELTPAPGAP